MNGDPQRKGRNLKTGEKMMTSETMRQGQNHAHGRS